ncbi:MAG: DUF1273 family protein [Oscillospiraceae bacterium]|nr:DUF1273 family protein [Oscillospiraceae bacterium]
MSQRDMTCCFTGHRPQKLPWGYNERDPRAMDMLDRLEQELDGVFRRGYRHFLCGMAEGCDLVFAELVLALREDVPSVTLEAAIPCPGQSTRWAVSSRARYDKILSLCDKISVISQTYTPDCMMLRNRYMVDRSSLLIACSNGRPGGTMSTIRYAWDQGLHAITIPVEL